jgi:hypothetical protein
LLGDGVDESCEIMVGDTLDLGHAFGRRRFRGGANRSDVRGRNRSQLRPPVESSELNL